MHINVLLLLQFEKLICKTCPSPNNSDFFYYFSSYIFIYFSIEFFNNCLLIQWQADGCELPFSFFSAVCLSHLTSFTLHQRFPSWICAVSWMGNICCSI